MKRPTNWSDSEASRLIRQLKPIAAKFEERTRVIVPVLWNPVRLRGFEFFEIPDLFRALSVDVLMDGLNVSYAAILTVGRGATLLAKVGLAAAAAFFVASVVLAPLFAIVILCSALIDWHVHNKGGFADVAILFASISV